MREERCSDMGEQAHHTNDAIKCVGGCSDTDTCSLFPALCQRDRRTQDAVLYGAVWPAGPGLAAMLKGTASAGFCLFYCSHTFSSIFVPSDKPNSHSAHFKLALYLVWV